MSSTVAGRVFPYMSGTMLMMPVSVFRQRMFPCNTARHLFSNRVLRHE